MKTVPAKLVRKETLMKSLAVTLILSATLTGQAYAQNETAAPSTSAPATSAASSSSVSHACKKEAHKLCGRAHGAEMQDCVKSNLDLKKFSANCATEFKNAAMAKKSGA
jgi:hypothetical protein